MSFIANQLRMPVSPISQKIAKRQALGAIIATCAFAALTACTTPQDGEITRDGIFDPYEAQNRAIHERSKQIDTAVIRPVAVAYAETVPDPAQELVANFAGNLAVPRAVVNQVLQFDLEGAARNSVRFGLNSTLGFGGIFDVAREFGLEEDEADFGQTLAVWGVPEGAYVELPIFGPSTERDAFGRVVDLIIDPMNLVPRPDSYYLTGVTIVSKVGKRGRFADSVDSVLYDSADSYAQGRLIYLQNRRYVLGLAAAPETSSEIDPYTELYGEEIDPYEELYGE